MRSHFGQCKFSMNKALTQWSCALCGVKLCEGTVEKVKMVQTPVSCQQREAGGTTSPITSPATDWKERESHIPFCFQLNIYKITSKKNRKTASLMTLHIHWCSSARYNHSLRQEQDAPVWRTTGTALLEYRVITPTLVKAGPVCMY